VAVDLAPHAAAAAIMSRAITGRCIYGIPVAAD
jgi:hypothetical protein